MALYQHEKNQAISSCCSRVIVDFKILQSDWPTAFWPISLELDFSKNMENNTNRKYYKPSLEVKFRKY